MKRRFWIGILTVMLILGVIGCGGSSSPVEPPMEPPASAPEAPTMNVEDLQGVHTDLAMEELQEACVLQVNISINPEFILYLDDYDVILGVKCLNRDAETVYAELDLMGQPYEVGFEAILEKSIEKGYAANGSEVHIQVNSVGDFISHESLGQITDKSHAVLGVVSYNHDLTMGIEIGSESEIMAPPAEEAPQDGQESGENPEGVGDSEWPKVEEETDAAGNVIKRTIIDDDGKYIRIYEYTSEGYEVSYTEYYPDGSVRVNFARVYHGTNPLSYTETNEFGESYDIVCDANGNPVKKTFYTPDREPIEHWLQGDKVVRERWTHKDGTITDVEYENDVKVKESTVWEDGSMNTILYQNGVMVSSENESILEDGRTRTATRSYEDGLLTEEVICYSDGAIDITRYANEVMIFSSGEFSDGTYDRRYYNENGLLIYREGYIAAWGESHSTKYTVGSNGLYTYSIYQSNDGYVEEVFYDSNGNKSSWKSVHTDGSVHEGVFDASGKYIEQ